MGDGMLDSGRFDGYYERVLAPGLVLCKITGTRKVTGEGKEDGTPPRTTDWYTLALQQAAKTTDGEVVDPGFYVEIGLGSYDQTNGDDGLEQANRISGTRTRELVCSALGLPKTHKNPSAELAKQGGRAALLNKLVGAKFSVGKTGRQNVDQFVSPSAWTDKPAAAATP